MCIVVPLSNSFLYELFGFSSREKIRQQTLSFLSFPEIFYFLCTDNFFLDARHPFHYGNLFIFTFVIALFILFMFILLVFPQLFFREIGFHFCKRGSFQDILSVFSDFMDLWITDSSRFLMS